MVNDSNKGRGSTPFGFIIISGFFLLWLILSIIPGLGILGDLIFRYMIGINMFTMTWPPFVWTSWGVWLPWDILMWVAQVIQNFVTAIVDYLINVIPIIGPIINFTRFWSKGEF